MPRLFGRRVAVQIDRTLYEDLRIDFNVTKTLQSRPLNKASITIYNVDEQLFESVVAQRRESVIQVFAGYEAVNRVFIGNPIKNGVSFEWRDADRILKIDAQDGYRSYQTGRLSLSLDANTVTLQDIVAQASAALNLPLGIIDIPGDAQLTQGISLDGPASNVLDRIAASTGSDWSIQNGALQFLPRRRARRSRGPRYSSELRNILEYPKLTEDGTALKVLLDPSLNPGDRFDLRVNNKRYDGVYKAITVKHTGSKWQNEFFTEIEARPWKEQVAESRGKSTVKNPPAPVLTPEAFDFWWPKS